MYINTDNLTGIIALFPIFCSGMSRWMLQSYYEQEITWQPEYWGELLIRWMNLIDSEANRVDKQTFYTKSYSIINEMIGNDSPTPS